MFSLFQKIFVIIVALSFSSEMGFPVRTFGCNYGDVLSTLSILIGTFSLRKNYIGVFFCFILLLVCYYFFSYFCSEFLSSLCFLLFLFVCFSSCFLLFSLCDSWAAVSSFSISSWFAVPTNLTSLIGTFQIATHNGLYGYVFLVGSFT